MGRLARAIQRRSQGRAARRQQAEAGAEPESPRRKHSRDSGSSGASES